MFQYSRYNRWKANPPPVDRAIFRPMSEQLMGNAETSTHLQVDAGEQRIHSHHDGFSCPLAALYPLILRGKLS